MESLTVSTGITVKLICLLPLRTILFDSDGVAKIAFTDDTSKHPMELERYAEARECVVHVSVYLVERALAIVSGNQ